MTRPFRPILLASVAALAIASSPAHAQSGAATTAGQAAERYFDIPAQSLDEALRAFARVADVQFAYSAELIAGRTSSGLRGRYPVQQGLARLLAGTALSFRSTDERTFSLQAAADPADGERVTGTVRVEGATGAPFFGGAGVAAGVNGINGSRDITATEGTGSFTSGALTIGSKVPQALKDVPQSISVLTSERLEQQNVTDFITAMRQLPGVTLVQNTTNLENTFYSRGFAIASIQVDGGAPLTTSYGFYPQIDMSIYDHVELLRGAAGQFNGYGTPGGTVNLVRKKPLDHAQFTVEAQAGSWSNYRVVADATSPLALDGKLRGRLVMTYQDRHYFYDTAKDNRTLIYGIAEFDATPSTLLTAGISYTNQDSVPWSGGFPRYLNGGDLKLPRSISFAMPWSRWDFDTTEIFGGIEQRLGDEWTAKLNLTHNRQNSTQKLGFGNGAVNPTNGLGPTLAGLYNDYASEQFSAEVVLSGAFTLFGQRQEITIGANRVKSDGRGYTNYVNLFAASAAAPYQPYAGGPLYYGGSPNGTSPPINVFAFDPSDPLYTEPRNPLRSNYYPAYGPVQSVVYANLRLTAFDRLHLTTGLRWSRYEYENEYKILCTTTTDSCLGKQIGDISSSSKSIYGASDFGWPPAVTLSFDATRSLTAYLGYTDIYTSQASYLTAEGQALDPVTGSNWEAGLKWAPRDGRLNLSLTAYRIERKGYGVLVGARQDLGVGRSCCYVSDPNQTQFSQGLDFEAMGEVLPGWQISASYTFNENKQQAATSEPTKACRSCRSRPNISTSCGRAMTSARRVMAERCRASASRAESTASLRRSGPAPPASTLSECPIPSPGLRTAPPMSRQTGFPTASPWRLMRCSPRGSTTVCPTPGRWRSISRTCSTRLTIRPSAAA